MITVLGSLALAALVIVVGLVMHHLAPGHHCGDVACTEDHR